MIDDYTRLLEAIAGVEDAAAADAAVTKLIRHMKSAGHLSMLPRVLRELRKIAARRAALRPRVEVAREEGAAAALAVARALGFDARHASVNPTLIRGWRATGDGKLVDRSAKRALAQIYQKVTA